ncbi:MAG: hypothetical protein ACXAC8_04180 [Candidatus Hodarchaeales archaeon]|jgi:hypothetical protein
MKLTRVDLGIGLTILVLVILESLYQITSRFGVFEIIILFSIFLIFLTWLIILIFNLSKASIEYTFEEEMIQINGKNQNVIRRTVILVSVVCFLFIGSIIVMKFPNTTALVFITNLIALRIVIHLLRPDENPFYQFKSYSVE